METVPFSLSRRSLRFYARATVMYSGCREGKKGASLIFHPRSRLLSHAKDVSKVEFKKQKLSPSLYPSVLPVPFNFFFFFF